MAGNVVGRLVIEMSASQARLEKDMAAARATVNSATRSINSAVGVTKNALASLAAGFSVVQTVRFFKGIIDDTDALSKLAQKTNMAVEQVVGWTHALDLADVSQDALQKTAKSVSSQMLDASRGLAEAQHNWAALDIDIKKNDGSLKSVNTILLEVADKYANATDKTMMMGLMTKVFGKSALDLIPALKDGREALAQLIAEGQALNPVTEESARQAEIFNDNMTRLSKTIKSVFIGAVNEALPALAEISDHLVRATKEGSTFWAVINEGAKLYLATVGALFGFIPGVSEATQKGFNALSPKSGMTLWEQMQNAKKNGPQAKPFTPRLTGSAGASKAAAEQKKLLDLGTKGEIDALIARQKAWKDEQKAINDLKNAGFDEDKKLLALGEEGELAAHIARVERIKGEMEAINDYRNSTLTVTNEVTEFWKSAAQSMQQSMSGFFFDVMQGNLSDLSGRFKRATDQMVADVLAAKAATALFGVDFGKSGNIGGLVGKGLTWLTSGGGGGGIDAMAMPALATGTPFVPRDMPAFLHRGEAVIPAAQNNGARGMSIINNFTITGSMDRRSQAQIAAAAGEGVQRALARNT